MTASSLIRRRDWHPRHPLDLSNTRVLSSIPGVEAIIKSLVSPVAEEALFMEQISSSILVGPSQLPQLHARLLRAAAVLGVRAPELYIKQAPRPNAYTLAVNGRKPIIVVHTALLELLDEAEVEAVLAHELGHLKCDHGIWLTAANALAAAGSLPGVPSFVEASIDAALLRWFRAAELSCDRAALLVAGEPRVVMSVLMKLAGGTPRLASQLNVDAFLAQSRALDAAASSSALGWYLSQTQTRGLSHPLPVARAQELDRWAVSAQCLRLLQQVAASSQAALKAAA